MPGSSAHHVPPARTLEAAERREIRVRLIGVSPDDLSAPGEGSLMLSRTVFAAIVLALALVAVSAASAKRPPPGGGGSSSGPTNLRITASSDTSISLAWDAANGGRPGGTAS